MSIELKGNWKKGYALDLHTKSSTYLGIDEYGYEQFDTTRTEIGQLLYDLKYNKDKTAVPQIIIIINEKVSGLKKMDLIIPIPPSRPRDYQPVNLIADALSKKNSIPVIHNEVIKIKSTPELKNIKDPIKREKILRNAFTLAGRTNLNNKNVLLIDDVYRSGATLRAVTGILYNIGNVKNVFVLVLTKTRSYQ